ncbi:retropepsin-like aspartic protease [Acetobacter papayae]|uniref:retropepsin-like aspartic protease n=1 Tax=Acetobacter papayae TaxID=1076592 RepID=UPI000AB45F19|nr:retropepsin-like aspartic protease [Acetobacter papayae]
MVSGQENRRAGWGRRVLPSLPRYGAPVAMALLAMAFFCSEANAEPAACQHLVARVSLRNDAGFINVPASLNGHAARMIVDTGSEGSLVSPEAMALFDMQPDRERRTVVQGTGGEGRLVPNAIIHSLRIGTVEFGPVSVPVEALPAIPALVPAIEGWWGLTCSRVTISNSAWRKVGWRSGRPQPQRVQALLAGGICIGRCRSILPRANA